MAVAVVTEQVVLVAQAAQAAHAVAVAAVVALAHRPVVPVALAVAAKFGFLGGNMRAHQLDADGVILNTILVDSIDVIPGLVNAEIGGGIGDRIVDGAVIPRPTVPPSVKDYSDAVQNHLDDAAKAKNYDDILSACSYAGAPNPFQEEGAKFVGWRGDVWSACYQILNDVQSGEKAAPTIAELIAELPALAL